MENEDSLRPLLQVPTAIGNPRRWQRLPRDNALPISGFAVGAHRDDNVATLRSRTKSRQELMTMGKSNPTKRKLKFHGPDEIKHEISALIESGYISHGQWNLSQSLGHLNEWMRFPMDGFPTPPLLMRIVFWVMRHTVGPGMKRKILEQGFSNGMPTAPMTVPQPEAMSDQAAADQYYATMERIRDYQGDLHPSPLFGPTDHELHQRVSLLHAEHHLGFLSPKKNDP